MGAQRLQKILARAGIASRRQAEDLIRQGRVRVNGELVRTPGRTADPAVDAIAVNGKRLRAPTPSRVFALHKPRGVVTTLRDPQGRPSVADLLPRGAGRLVPVGRLDYHSEGLLLLTNDGDLAQSILRPGSPVPKTYHAKVRGTPSAEALARFAAGMVLDGRRTLPARAVPMGLTRGGNSWVEVTLQEGRRNQIRRLFLALGHPVQRLRRVRMGPVRLGDLPPGKARELHGREVEALRRLAGGEGQEPRRRPRRPDGRREVRGAGGRRG